MSDFNLTLHFFFQLACILAACRVAGLIAKRFQQPQVVAEMITGVLLGPSLLGWLAPELQNRLFPKPTMSVIYVAGQLGLVLYMFLVGVEFQTELLRRKLRSALGVSAAGIVVPFTLGALYSLHLVSDGAFFASGVSRWEGILYLGAAMSITAFPMLARIIYERGMAGTSLGTLTLAAGAADDAAAWCILAIVVASFSGDGTVALYAIGGGVCYVIAVLGGLRRLLAPLGPAVERRGSLSSGVLAFVLILALVGAWFTDYVGVYAVFGAFIMGIAIPRGLLSRELQRLIEPLTTTLLLPMFFIYSGLNTRFDLLITPSLWIVAAIVILLACAGKGLACAAAAWLGGHPPREAMAIGALMNARGLMELVILNIGLERGLITPTLFTVMVLMAILTTLAAGPLFELVYRREGASIGPATEAA